MDMLDFSGLKPHVEPFRGPDGNMYELRSATAAATTAYRDAISNTATWDGDKVVKVNSSFGAELLLVSWCVFNAGNPVGVDLLNGWPPEVIEALHKRIVDVSPGLHSTKAGKAPLDPKALKNGAGGPSS